jgi:hypothetical protein
VKLRSLYFFNPEIGDTQLPTFKKYLVIAACCNCFLLGRYSAKRKNQLIEEENLQISLKAHNTSRVESTSLESKSASHLNKNSTLGQIITKKNYTFDSKGRVKSKTEVTKETITQQSVDHNLTSLNLEIGSQKSTEADLQQESLIKKKKELLLTDSNWSIGVMSPIGNYQLSTLELNVQYRLFSGIHIGLGSKVLSPDFKIGLSVDL